MQANSQQEPEPEPVVNILNGNTINSRVWPIPFSSHLTVQYNLQTGGEVLIRLLTIDGKLASILGREYRLAGLQTQNFEVSAPSGNYVLQIIADNQKASHIIIKK